MSNNSSSIVDGDYLKYVQTWSFHMIQMWCFYTVYFIQNKTTNGVFTISNEIVYVKS